MSEVEFSSRSVRRNFVSAVNRKREMRPMEAKVAFDSWLAEIERAAAEKAWDACKQEVFGTPHWFNSETGVGGFDMGDDEDGNAVETGAFMYLRRKLADNPYRAAALGLTAGQEGEKDE